MPSVTNYAETSDCYRIEGSDFTILSYNKGKSLRFLISC